MLPHQRIAKSTEKDIRARKTISLLVWLYLLLFVAPGLLIFLVFIFLIINGFLRSQFL